MTDLDGVIADLEIMRRLLDHIDGQAETILSLKEYVAALENSMVLREVTRRFSIPPPG